MEKAYRPEVLTAAQETRSRAAEQLTRHRVVGQPMRRMPVVKTELMIGSVILSDGLRDGV
jgi:hypothetical protein